MKKYVIYLTEYLGDKLPRWYIGSTYKDNIIKNNYNGSPRSKKWKNLYEEEQTYNKHLFRTEILYECYDREAAIDIERKFQIHAKAVEREDYMNMSYAGGSFGKCNLTTPESIVKGLETKRKNGNNICKEQTKIKISQSNKGKKMSEEAKTKMSVNGKGKIMPDSMKEKTSNRMKGNKLSEETKSKIGLANSKFYNVYNDKGELILHNVSIYDEEFKVYEFPATFVRTAKFDYKMYENAKNIIEKFRKYKNWYMEEII